jgi:Plant mobile domain
VHPLADAYSWSRSLEAYLLWLLGCVLLCNSKHGQVDPILLHYAREIADAEENQVPVWSWGSAVLAATYRGLCDASVSTRPNPTLKGCPLLLQLWAYERIAVGRPRAPIMAYGPEFYGPRFQDHGFSDDGPTMASHWIAREVREYNPSCLLRTLYFP